MDIYKAIEWVRYDARTTFFTYALQYLNWECVEGDLLEFGVSVGKSLALIALLYRENLSLWQYTEPVCNQRRLGGFDSFTGLPAGQHPHPRWKAGSFATNYLSGHPSLGLNQKITPDAIHRLFDTCGLARPEIEQGWFADSIPRTISTKYRKVALLHIDSDLYESALSVLEGVAPVLSNGALVCFDDWFMYRGDPNQGEARALKEFLEKHPEWQAIHYQTYSVFCNSFIFRRTSNRD